MNEETVKTIGILGGGQLGQMSAIAAKKIGIKTIIYTPESNSPASQVADETIVAPYDDESALQKFADKCDVISYEFENIPISTVRFLKNTKPVFPEDNLLNIAQDRIKEKQFLNDAGIPTTQWAEIKSADDIKSTLKEWDKNQAIIKTTRFGYDGKGQVFIKNINDIDAAWAQLSTDIAIAEAVIDFDCEISVIIARDKNENVQTYGPCLNDHKNHILHKTTLPAGLNEKIEAQAIEKTIELAHAIDLQGVLALEMFVTNDGQILANEIAPRTHNSGHWSIDACKVSQFENHVRTVCGLDALPAERHSDCEMINLIGEDISDLGLYKSNKKAYIHDYGKTEIKPGRKMGHVTILK